MTEQRFFNAVRTSLTLKQHLSACLMFALLQASSDLQTKGNAPILS